MSSHTSGGKETIYCERCGEELFVGRKWVDTSGLWGYTLIGLLFIRWRKFSKEAYHFESKDASATLCLDCQEILKERIEKAKREADRVAMKQRIQAWEESH